MDSRGRFDSAYLARTSSFNMVLASDDAGGEFWNTYKPSIILDNHRKWEIAIIDAFMPSLRIQSEVKEDHWFQYIVMLRSAEDNNINIDAYNKNKRYLHYHYYDPTKFDTIFASLAGKFHQVQESPDFLGEYTNTRLKPRLRLFVDEEGYGCIEILEEMRSGESAMLSIPDDQYLEFFGGSTAFYGYLNGKLITQPSDVMKTGRVPYCYYNKDTKDLQVVNWGYDDSLPDDALKDVELKGGIFKSTEKSMQHPRRAIGGSQPLIDVECNIIETNRLGGIKEGMRILGTLYPSIPENKSLTYVPLETLSFDSIRIKLLDSFTKVPIVISEDKKSSFAKKSYIVINIRPV